VRTKSAELIARLAKVTHAPERSLTPSVDVNRKFETGGAGNKTVVAGAHSSELGRAILERFKSVKSERASLLIYVSLQRKF
jgi:hypothetical protein